MNGPILHQPEPEQPREIGPRAFVLQRNEDETGVSGTGIVAEGVEFSDGTVALRWTSAWPTSVVFHDRGIDSVVHVHGHGGKTQVVFDDSATELRKLRRALVYYDVIPPGDWGIVLEGDDA